VPKQRKESLLNLGIQYPNVFFYFLKWAMTIFVFFCFLKWAMTILITDGFVEFVRRIKDHVYRKPHQLHSYIMVYKNGSGASAPVPKIELEIKEITAFDIDEIDELTDSDEWKISKQVTLKHLEEGWHCYIAKQKGQIVAINWIILLESFEEFYFKRQFNLSPNEAYHFRGWSIPQFRGKGVMPFLLRNNCDETALKYGKTRTYGWVNVYNYSQLRCLAKAGWTRAGRAGFIEIFGIRFHYLWGREAFKETKKRFLIQNLK
jgi:GNAT superfamily N-acetyltransferase